MKKLILPVVLFILSFLVFSYSVYAVPEETTSSQNSSSSYNPYCWDTHMGDQMAVCSKTHTQCVNKCTPLGNSGGQVPCLNECSNALDVCFKQSSADYKTCIEAERQAKKQPETNQIKPSGNPESPFDEAACHESCQSNYDSCTSECRSADIFNNSNSSSDTSASCSGTCNAVYNSTFENIRKACFDTWWSCGIAIYNRSDCGGNSCSQEVEEKCDKPYDACLQPAQDAADKCLEGCGVETNQGLSPDTDACYGACEQTRSSCSQTCREAGQAAVISQSPEKPSVGVSSRDFRALVRANAEYQKAQADLDKLKADQNFSDTYNTELDKVSQQTEKPPENYVQAVREKLEWGKDALEAYQAIDELQDYLDNRKFESYGRVSLITDVGNGLITFTDLVADGVSVENASTKAIIDTAAPSLFYLVPPLKAADMIATLPDDFLATFGIPKDNLIRVGTGFLADNSPSAFVEITTDAMIKTGNWTNVGGALQVAWDDVQAAEGIGEKAKATLDLVGTAVGAIPVAIVMSIRDEISAVFFEVENAGNLISNISSWFTYPE